MQQTEPSRSVLSVRPAPLATPPDSGLRKLHAVSGAEATEAAVLPPPTPQRKLRRGLSILQKLLILILSLVLGVVGLLAGYLLSRQVAEMRTSLTAKASAYGRLVSKQVESAIAFDDRETAREVFDSVAQDEDVESLTLFTSSGNVLRAWGSISPEAAELAKHLTERRLIERSDRISVVSPVVSLEGPRGTLVVELSTRGLTESLLAAKQRAALGFIVAALLGALGAFIIARSLARRLSPIANAANAVAAGELDQKPVNDGNRSDEIGTMVTAFNTMVQQIRGLVEHIQSAAREEKVRLELLVSARTAELDARNGDMRRVLDNVGQGFLTLNTQCEMSRERSAILTKWFGNAPESGNFIDYVRSVEAGAAEWFSVGWDALIEDTLPLEVTLDQLPKQLLLADKHFEFEYRPILGHTGQLERVLVVLSDVTAVRERERAEVGEREVTRLFSRMVADRPGFLEFFAEAQALIERVNAPGADAVKLLGPLHTLKGNTSIYGIDSIAKLCHELENTLNENSTASRDDLRPLLARWGELAEKIQTLLGDSSDRLDIAVTDYHHLLTEVQGHAPHADIESVLQGWRLEPTETRLRRIAEHAEALAVRLDKGPIQIEIESNELRLPPEQWTEFWTAAVHVVRNAVDHGLESAEERLQARKPARGKVSFRTSVVGDEFAIEFADDGRGIDWARVAAKAKDRGMPAEKRADLVDALFAEGLSTRDTATEVSGRGVGLSVVRTACQKLGGKIEVDSTPGKGSRFRFVWPSGLVTGMNPPNLAGVSRVSTKVVQL